MRSPILPGWAARERKNRRRLKRFEAAEFWLDINADPKRVSRLGGDVSFDQLTVYIVEHSSKEAKLKCKEPTWNEGTLLWRKRMIEDRRMRKKKKGDGIEREEFFAEFIPSRPKCKSNQGGKSQGRRSELSQSVNAVLDMRFPFQ